MSAVQVLDAMLNISIHALREEGDFGKTNRTIHHDLFLSTPSARRATDFRTLFFLE